jgi:F420-non-reducing hydrogenase small subunit
MSTNGSPKKPGFAMYWASSCGGCEIAVLNIGEKILEVDAAFDVVFWPVAMDAKYDDVEKMADGSILLTLFNGGIRNDENEAMAQLLRKKSALLVSFGSCASEGCIPGLGNFSSTQNIIDTAFSTITTDNPENIRPAYHFDAPEGELHIPVLNEQLRTLDQVVDVDYYIPGCPPESHQIAAVIDVVLAAVRGEVELPPKGSVLGAGESTVCDECDRERNIKKITEFKRIQDILQIDPALCLLEQGVLCNGPATRSGCTARCPTVSAPCIGCYGPAPGVVDFGARMISALASIIDSNDPDEIEKILDGIVDPAGSFYRFNLAHSMLHAARPVMSKS